MFAYTFAAWKNSSQNRLPFWTKRALAMILADKKTERVGKREGKREGRSQVPGKERKRERKGEKGRESVGKRERGCVWRQAQCFVGMSNLGGIRGAYGVEELLTLDVEGRGREGTV